MLLTWPKIPLSFGISFQKELAKSITYEQGKTLADAEGDVFRGLRKFTPPRAPAELVKPLVNVCRVV